MKKTSPSILALVAALGLAIPTAGQAQQQTSTQPLPGETSREFAVRIDACDGSEILSSRFVGGQDRQNVLRVRCRGGAAMADTSGMAGGLGAGAIAGIAVTVVAIAIAASSGGGSSTPSTTN